MNGGTMACAALICIRMFREQRRNLEHEKDGRLCLTVGRHLGSQGQPGSRSYLALSAALSKCLLT